MAPSATALALGSLVSIAVVGLVACSGEIEESSTDTSSTTDTSVGGTSTSVGGGGTGGGGTAGAAGTTTPSGGGGTGGGTGGTTTGTGGSGTPCSTFAQRYGSAGAADQDMLAGVVADASGGVIAAGELSGSMSVGAQTLASAGGKDAFVVRLNEGGGVAWAKRFGATFDDRVKGIAGMPDGGAVVVGVFDGVVDFGGVTLTSIAGPDSFVLRLSQAGDLVFVLQLENADARAVAVEDGGDILVAGDFMGTTAFGPIVLTSSQPDVFVARLGADGMVLAAKQFAFPAKAGVLAIGVGAGRTYLTGSFQGSIDFGAGPLVSAGSRDVFLARLDGALDAAYAERFGDSTSQDARAVAVLSDGSAVIAGSFKGTLDLDGLVLVADTQDDAFVARVDEAGAAVFARRFGDADAQTARAVAVNAVDGIAVGGGFFGTIDVGDGPLTSAAGEDAFVALLDENGVAASTLRFGGDLDQRVRGVSVDACGAIVLGGDFNGTLPFGGDVLAATGALDVFVARLGPQQP